jgi:predicted nucleic acid-binding protein
MDAFDADVLIYAAIRNHPLGRRVRAVFPVHADEPGASAAAVGSVLLIAEVLSKPLREAATQATRELRTLLSRLRLLPVDAATAELAAELGASYRLRAADAVHLATAVGSGADRFFTNNTRDFPKSITEIDVTYPDELPDSASG